MTNIEFAAANLRHRTRNVECRTKNKLIYRRMTWIPAFAGMTETVTSTSEMSRHRTQVPPTARRILS